MMRRPSISDSNYSFISAVLMCLKCFKRIGILDDGQWVAVIQSDLMWPALPSQRWKYRFSLHRHWFAQPPGQTPTSLATCTVSCAWLDGVIAITWNLRGGEDVSFSLRYPVWTHSQCASWGYNPISKISSHILGSLWIFCCNARKGIDLLNLRLTQTHSAGTVYGLWSLPAKTAVSCCSFCILLSFIILCMSLPRFGFNIPKHPAMTRPYRQTNLLEGFPQKKKCLQLSWGLPRTNTSVCLHQRLDDHGHFLLLLKTS